MMKRFSVQLNFRRHALAGIALFLSGALSSASAQAMDGFDFPIGNPFASNYEVSGFAFLENTKPFCDELKKWGFHTGEDWNSKFPGAADKDDPVLTVADGKIEFAGWGGTGWGNAVVIRHTAPAEFPFQIPDPDDGTFKGRTLEEVWSQYGHMNSIALNPAAFDPTTQTQRKWKPGDFIKRGQQIGTVGDFPAGAGSAYHLHFEIRPVGTDKKEFGKDVIRAVGQDANPYVFKCTQNVPQEKTDARKDWVKKHYIWPTKFVELNRATTDSEQGFWHLIDNKRTKGKYPQDVVDISILSPDINPRLVTLSEGDDGKLPHSACGTVMTCQTPSQGLWWYGVNNHTGRGLGLADNGTFIDWVFDDTLQPSEGKNGGESTRPNNGHLTFEFDLASIINPVLQFRTWWEIESVDADRFDLMQVFLIDANGVQHHLKTLNPTVDVDGLPEQPYTSQGFNLPPVWVQENIDVSTFAGQEVKIVFFFDTRDRQYNAFRGWLIDSPRVFSSSAASATELAVIAIEYPEPSRDLGKPRD